MFTVLAAESVDADHPGHDGFVDRYRGSVRTWPSGSRPSSARGTMSAAIAPASLAVLLIAVMDGLQLQHLLDPDAVDMVEPLADLLRLLDGRA